jgi:hypothetical protein
MVKVNIDNNLEKVESQIDGPGFKIFSEITLLILYSIKENPKLLEDIKNVILTIDYSIESDVPSDKLIEFFTNAYFKTIKDLKKELL